MSTATGTSAARTSSTSSASRTSRSRAVGPARPVELEVESLGTVPDPWGNPKAVLSATTDIDREEFGITWSAALETGGVLVGPKVRIEIDVQLGQEG